VIPAPPGIISTFTNGRPPLRVLFFDDHGVPLVLVDNVLRPPIGMDGFGLVEDTQAPPPPPPA
jgi:hypothetical protein